MRNKDRFGGARNGAGIYKITNTESGKIYIGSAIDLYRRASSHIRNLRQGKHANKHLQSAFDKYGEDVFMFEVVEYVDDHENLISREQHWIDELNAAQDGYNKTPTAGSMLGFKFSEESKRKMSQSRTGRKMNYTPEGLASLEAYRKSIVVSEETKKRISESLRGRELTEAEKEARQRVAEARKGYKHSEETKRKIRESNLGRKRSQETCERNRQARIGKKRSPESVEKSAAWHRGRKDSPDVVARRAQSNTGKKRTPEQIERIKAGQAAARARKKALQAGNV